MELKIPYRINWAGAYLDCVDESVIASPINKYINFTFFRNETKKVKVFSSEFNEEYTTDLQPRLLRDFKWTDYIDGCVAVFNKNDFVLHFGCDIIVNNDLPSGIGVSSSAAFIVGIIKCIAEVNKLNLSDNIISKFAYWVEHDYLGIPCGRMDFKAVLHKPGIWKIHTDTDDLTKDRLLDKSEYTGLLLYKNKKHDHSTDPKFIDNVSKIRNTKFNYKVDFDTQCYISLEENIVNSITYLSNNDKITASYLGQFLNQSSINIQRWLGLETNLITLPGAIYGDKIVGSGLRGAHFLLVDPEKINEIKAPFEKDNWNIIVCKL